MLNNGALIADRYRLQRLIATGGMGQVWEALDTRLDRRVAVKVLKAEFSADPTFRHRFRTEAKTTAQLNHPGIAGIYDYGETMDPQGGETAYLVMELVQGEPLNAVLNRLGRLSVAQGLDMLEQTGRALEVAHAAGVVHRDVKPGNILVTPTGQVKITDFGIAKAVDASPVTKTGMVMGTAQYIAPEQATGEDATSASDVYSLGVVGYEALAGHRPFSGDGALTVAMKHVREAPPPMPADLPPNVRELIDITMTKDPNRRYRSGGEFADAVAAVRSGRRPPPPRGVAGPGATTTGAARVLPPAAGPTAVLPRGEYENATMRYATPNHGGPQTQSAGSTAMLGGPHTPPPRENESRFGNMQKALAGLGVGALVLGGLAAWVLLSGKPPESTTPNPVQSSTAVVTTTTTAPPTTTTEPPTTTRPIPPPITTTTPPPETTTTTPPPTSSTTTTTAPETTTTAPTRTRTTTTGRYPIPTLPRIPGAGGTVNDSSTTATSPQGLP
ncbi:protein kinase domain-containing protein [Nocardia transvalensis]|uniref:protein kinase domain-containing protein n=1 Tax=Nocardia transvalensis TaxID=37333 RepID=UPI001894A755|nr:protein kinase [Nocardia transvalensis]MBF6328684.1 serine/threonine protein kinase [Nocardia transvalensis]